MTLTCGRVLILVLLASNLQIWASPNKKNMLCSVFLPFCARAFHRVQFSISVRKAIKILALSCAARKSSDQRVRKGLPFKPALNNPSHELINDPRFARIFWFPVFRLLIILYPHNMYSCGFGFNSWPLFKTAQHWITAFRSLSTQEAKYLSIIINRETQAFVTVQFITIYYQIMLFWIVTYFYRSLHILRLNYPKNVNNQILAKGSPWHIVYKLEQVKRFY